MPRLPTLAVVALGLAAGACAPSGGELTAVNNPSLYSVHQPIVQRTDFVIDLATSGDHVAPPEQARLHAWLASIGAAYADHISVDQPRGYDSPSVRSDIARVAADYGLLLSDGAPVLAGEVAPGQVRVIASRATASVPNCPDWSEDQIVPTVNTSSNFGCSTNANLAAMIANPEDLIHGQEGPVTGATTAGRAVRLYRERAPTGTQPLQSTTTSRGGGN